MKNTSTVVKFWMFPLWLAAILQSHNSVFRSELCLYHQKQPFTLTVSWVHQESVTNPSKFTNYYYDSTLDFHVSCRNVGV